MEMGNKSRVTEESVRKDAKKIKTNMLDVLR